MIQGNARLRSLHAWARTALALLTVAVLGALPARAGQAYATNSGSNSVSVIDTATNTVSTTIAVGLSPRRPAASPDGKRVYVPNKDSDSVSVIDTAANAVVATIPVIEGPAVIAVTPDSSRVFVGGANGLVSVIDVAQGAVVATIAAGAPSTGEFGSPYEVNGLAISPDGTRAYALWGELVVIDTATNSVVSSIYAGNFVSGLALSADGARVYVSNSFGYGDFSFSGSVAVVDASAGAVSDVIWLYSVPSSIVVAPDEARAYIATPSVFVSTGYGSAFISSPWVATVDLGTNATPSGFSVGKPAAGIAMNSDGSRVYIAVPNSHSVAVIDTTTNTIVASVSVGAYPQGVVVAPEPAPDAPGERGGSLPVSTTFAPKKKR